MSEPTKELADPTAVQVHFLRALPRIERHAKVQFSHLKGEARQDAIQKTLGLNTSRQMEK